MKRIQDSYEYKMVKQITTEQNKKALKKASIDFMLLITSMYFAIYIFVYLTQWIWS